MQHCMSFLQHPLVCFVCSVPILSGIKPRMSVQYSYNTYWCDLNAVYYPENLPLSGIKPKTSVTTFLEHPLVCPVAEDSLWITLHLFDFFLYILTSYSGRYKSQDKCTIILTTPTGVFYMQSTYSVRYITQDKS